MKSFFSAPGLASRVWADSWDPFRPGRMSARAERLWQYFVLGKSDSRTSETSINQEIEAFDDIVIGDFVDSYRDI